MKRHFHSHLLRLWSPPPCPHPRQDLTLRCRTVDRTWQSLSSSKCEILSRTHGEAVWRKQEADETISLPLETVCEK